MTNPPESMSTNRTSQAVTSGALTAQNMKGFVLGISKTDMLAIAAKYKKYEIYAMAQAEKGDMEAKEAVEFDPLA